MGQAEIWESAYGPDTTSVIGGAGSRATLRYIIQADSESLARLILRGKYPRTYDGLEVTGYDVRDIAPAIWEAQVYYGYHEDRPTASFDTTGATQRITEAISQTHYARNGETAPDVGERIGDDGDTVEGVDIVVPTFRYTESHTRQSLSPQYINKLILLTGTVNSQDFKGFPVFSLLFMGARGSQRQDGVWQIDYDFLAGVNRTSDDVLDPFGGLMVDDINVTIKYAHDYLWVRYMPEVDATAKARRGKVQSVHVARVYKSEDFAQLEIGISTPPDAPGASVGGFWDD